MVRKSVSPPYPPNPRRLACVAGTGLGEGKRRLPAGEGRGGDALAQLDRGRACCEFLWVARTCCCCDRKVSTISIAPSSRPSKHSVSLCFLSSSSEMHLASPKGLHGLLAGDVHQTPSLPKVTRWRVCVGGASMRTAQNLLQIPSKEFKSYGKVAITF